MKKSILITMTLTLVAAISVSVLYSAKPTAAKSPVVSDTTPTPAPPAGNKIGNEAPAAEATQITDAGIPVAAQARLETMRKEWSDLKFEIERGEYVRLINDENTPPAIKSELREKVVSLVRKANQIADLQIQLIEESNRL
ncbi:MAG TPA: hypothetical protein PKC28_11705 [Bdellovibrionales bacterium]|nr:hypothetical protein [Bdellovibrionales bacterium]